MIFCAIFLHPNTQAGVGSGQDPGELIKIIGPHLEGRLDQDPNSGYNRLFKAILPTDTHYFEFGRYPLVRAVRDFTKNKRVCMFPTSRYALEILTNDAKTPLIESAPVDLVSSHIFTASSEVDFSTVMQLDGRSIAIQHAIIATQFLGDQSKANITRTPNDLTALKMVLAGRVDAMYGWFPDTYIIAEKNGLSLPHFNPELILFKTTTHLVCKKFDGNELLFKIVNMRIKNLKHRGELQKILGKHARIVDD